MNGAKSCQKKLVFVGLRQHMRSLSEIPAELRTKGLEDPPPSLALWQLKSEKKQKNPEESELLSYSGLQPGVFFSDNLEALHWQFLQEGKAPLVQLSALLKVSALVWPLPPAQGKKQKCIVRRLPEDAELLQRLGKKLGIPYAGTGCASFGYHCLLTLLRHKRGVTTIGPGQCFLCGAPSEETHHQPALSRNTEKSKEEPVCKQCHEEVTNADAKFDAGWMPLTSTLCPQTAQFLHLPREKPFVACFSQPQQKGFAEVHPMTRYVLLF